LIDADAAKTSIARCLAPEQQCEAACLDLNPPVWCIESGASNLAHRNGKVAYRTPE
jgi:hypothetical protein